MSLERFVLAQESRPNGFATALAELEAGRKTGHWIWYVFPQLAGLGRSSTAVQYGLAGAEEAADYLRDRVLGERLVTAAAVVRMHLTNARPARLEELMGSHIDALKLVSSMTLFRQVTRTLGTDDSRPQLAAMTEHADIILAAAAAQGYGRCTYTEEHLRRLGT